MAEYEITWTIDLEDDTPEHAALSALGIHRDPESIATVFHVRDVATGQSGYIDVENPDNPVWLRKFGPDIKQIG